MENETARQAYICLLRERVDFPDSLTAEQRDLVLRSELIYGDYLDGVVNTNASGMFPSSVVTGLPKSKGRLFLQQLEKEELDASIVQKHRDAFKSLDRRKLLTMDDKSLAEWQSNFKQDEPEWRITEHEWQRRITATQIRAGRWSIAFALFGIIVGAFLHWSLSSWHPFENQRHSPDVEAQTKIDTKSNQQQPTATQIQTPSQSFPLAPVASAQTNLTSH